MITLKIFVVQSKITRNSPTPIVVLSAKQFGYFSDISRISGHMANPTLLCSIGDGPIMRTLEWTIEVGCLFL